LHPRIKNLWANKITKTIVGLVALYLLFSYFAVDPLARRVLPWFAEKQLNSRMTVERVTFDPFALTITIDNLTLTSNDNKPLAGFQRLYLDLETKGIFDFAWRFKDIQLIAPKVSVDIAPNGTLNWAALIAKLNESPTQDSEMARVMIDHLLIEAGNLQYSERNRPKPFNTVLKPLGLELEGLSTLPKDRGDYIVSAKFPEQGAVMKWKGELSLNPVASKGVIDVEGLKVAKVMQLINLKSFPLQVNDGQLKTRFNYQFAMVNAEPEPFPQAKLTNFRLSLTKLGSLYNSQAKLSLDSAEISMPALDFSMQHDTQITFEDVSFTAKQLSVMQNDLTLFKLPLVDVSGVGYNLAENQLKIANILLNAGELGIQRGVDGELNWQKLVSKEVQAVDEHVPVTSSEETKDIKPFKFDVAQIQLQDWKAHLIDQTFIKPIKAEIKDIDVALYVDNSEGDIGVHQINTTLENISLTSDLSQQPMATLNKVTLKNAEVSLKNSTVQIPELVLSGLKTEVLRAENQQVNWQTALAQVANSTAQANEPSTAKDWNVNLDRVTLENSNLHFEDKATPRPVILDIENAMVALQNASLDLKKSLPIKAKLKIKQGGEFNVDGRVALSPLKSDLKVKLNGLSLKPFSPYINQFALLKLDDGKASLLGKLSMKSEKAFASQFTGGFSVTDLSILEEDTGTPFLGWKDLKSDSLTLNISPNQLHMGSLSIVEPVGKFIIFEDKTLNVKRILRPQDSSSPAAQPPDVASTENSFPVNIERISINNGDLEFADLSLRPQFGTHINTLSGVINGLSNDVSSTAQVELDGKVDDYGSASIRGTVQPFQATEFTDLKLAFHNLEMNRLTPYSGKFAGRKIESGKLSVDLEYKIKQRKLAGENKFVINKIQLGERVESPDAADLPLDLAIALLEDSDGLIDLDLPIQGSLDDPQFSYSKIVWKAFVNVLGKIVTAPFRLLGKLFGGDSDKLGSITFAPGSADISPEQQEKLNSLTKALEKRPALLLTILPTYDAQADKVALQEQHTRLEVLKEMEVDIKAGERPGPVDVANVKAQIAIDNLLKDRKGEARGIKAIEAVKNAFRKSKPEDVPVYQKKLEALKKTAPVSEQDLIELAKFRGEALQAYLTDQGHLNTNRTSIGELSKISGDGKVVDIKMSLGVAKK
jgi:uncharacterized protein involved in outer membrane biogenesis